MQVVSEDRAVAAVAPCGHCQLLVLFRTLLLVEKRIEVFGPRQLLMDMVLLVAMP